MELTNLAHVQEIMDTLLYEVTYKSDQFEPSVAYTYSRKNDLCGTVYRIFVNNKNQDLCNFLYLHECGHIIFSHAKNIEKREDQFLKVKILSAYNQVSDMFDSKESIMDYFRNMVYNVVMDFEVNSKLYTQQEWEQGNQILAEVLNKPGAKGMWPQDFGYPPGLTWNEYLNLILLKPKNFLETLKQSFREELKAQSKGEKKVYSPEEYEKLKKELLNPKFNKGELEKIKKLSQDHGNSVFSIPTGTMDGMTRDKADPIKIQYESYTDMHSLLKKIRKVLMVSRTELNRRDPLYNYNRRKYDTSVIIPHTVKQTVHVKPSLYLLFDISGSVEPELIHDFISTFSQFQKEYKDTRIILWNTNLVGDYNINEDIPNDFGGGTQIAAGIYYTNIMYKLSKQDILFVISDFEDILEEWNTALKTIRCKKYAVNWNPKKLEYNPGFLKIYKYEP